MTDDLIVQHGLTKQWWRIRRDCGESEPVGPFATRKEAETLPVPSVGCNPHSEPSESSKGGFRLSNRH